MMRLIILCLCLFCVTEKSFAALKFYSRGGGGQLTLGFVGDIILHRSLIVQSKKKGVLFLWKKTLPVTQHANILVANLEGPIAAGVNQRGRYQPGRSPWDLRLYTGYPLFNYPPALAEALSQSHVSLATTANNHALDRYSLGINKTIAILHRHGIVSLGTKSSKRLKSPWYRLTDSHGVRIAWIACTTGINGMKDRHHQVLRCYQSWGRRTILSLVKRLRHRVDAVIVLPHWGRQYQFIPDAAQQRFAHQVLNAGALMVIGTHPHVLQPFRLFRTRDHRNTFVAYSLGNFVSYQGSVKNRTSVILFVSLAKHHGRTLISRIAYQPVFMRNRSGMGRIQLTLLQSKRKHPASWRILRHTLGQG